MEKRYIYGYITADLKEKMVFIGGPRQVGKTTLALEVAQHEFPTWEYLNWDNEKHKIKIHKEDFDLKANLLVFDELHKYRQWKNYIKGIYDVHKDQWRILLTGSARLDVYQRGGDSLMGRYHYWRLHPFSVAEAAGIKSSSFTPRQELPFSSATKASREAFEALEKYGGFPEPFFRQNERFLKRWQRQRTLRVVKEDIRDIEIIRDLSKLELLLSMLPERVSSILSLNNLREDLLMNHGTVAHWMEVLERFYYHFRISPFASTIVKSVRKEPKLYLWDWSEVRDSAARLENIVASHLLKFVHFLQDAEGHHAELQYLRDVTGREADFVVTVDRKPWFAVEVKESDQTVSKHLVYFAERLKIPFLFQVVRAPGLDRIHAKSNVRIMSVDAFLAGLV